MTYKRRFSKIKLFSRYKERPIDFNFGYANSLMRGLNETYVSNMVLQGIISPTINWEKSLKRDLILSTRHPFLDQQIDEAVAIIADKDTW